jgi:hypothetical protein
LDYNFDFNHRGFENPLDKRTKGSHYKGRGILGLEIFQALENPKRTVVIFNDKDNSWTLS